MLLSDIFKNKELSNLEAVKLLNSINYTVDELETIVNTEALSDISKFIYVQALYKLVLQNKENYPLLQKIHECKKKLLGAKNIISNLYHKNRLVLVEGNYSLLNLMHQIDDTIKEPVNFNIVAKKLSTNTHKYGFIIINNVLKRPIKYNLTNLLNKNIKYYRGLSDELINELQSIEVENFSTSNINIETYNEEFCENAKCYYYIIMTTNSKTYNFLSLSGFLYVDKTCLCLEWSSVIGVYNELMEENLLKYLEPTPKITKISQHKYNINYTDLTTFIVDELFRKNSKSNFGNVEAIINLLLITLVNYISTHVSNLYKTEIFSVFVSEKNKLKKLLYYELKELTSSESYNSLSDLEFNIKIYDIVYGILQNSKLFDTLYFKELLLQ